MRNFKCDFADMIDNITNDLNITFLSQYNECIYHSCSCPIYCKTRDDTIEELCGIILYKCKSAPADSVDTNLFPRSINHLLDLLGEINKRKNKAIDNMHHRMDDESRYQAPTLIARTKALQEQIIHLDNLYNAKSKEYLNQLQAKNEYDYLESDEAAKLHEQLIKELFTE